MCKDKIVNLVDDIINRLESNLSKSDIVDGWDDNIKCRVLNYFLDLKNKIIDDEKIEHLGIVRSLDFDGVCRGELIIAIAILIKDVRKYIEEEDK